MAGNLKLTEMFNNGAKLKNSKKKKFFKWREISNLKTDKNRKMSGEF